MSAAFMTRPTAPTGCEPRRPRVDSANGDPAFTGTRARLRDWRPVHVVELVAPPVVSARQDPF